MPYFTDNMRPDKNKYGIYKDKSNAYYSERNAFGEIVFVLRDGYKECGCYSGECGCTDKSFFDDYDDDVEWVGPFESKSNRRLLLTLR